MCPPVRSHQAGDLPEHLPDCTNKFVAQAGRCPRLQLANSQGPASLPRLSEKQFAQLEAELAKAPAAHGWEDQRWTLARIKTVIGRRFHLTYTVQGARRLLVRNGWSCQVPARRAVERDDKAVTG
ncbi:winged helix-turn-helix domain-containing protein [Streptomyces globisporus]|uniref:Winged helix-turn-helix domain-containing protein n=1 Tax=Streptomyces globisporus TaxID=1908 RepID=A0A423UXD6_STRGL|nr:winged helix-turn-helix domain-containing protein [Streptomyces globisporus]